MHRLPNSSELLVNRCEMMGVIASTNKYGRKQQEAVYGERDTQRIDANRRRIVCLPSVGAGLSFSPRIL